MTYQEEKDKVLNTILQNLWFKHWKNDDVTGLRNRKEYSIELFITSSCNQNCEYCYLQKYKELYPPEYNKPELILKNLRLLFDWLLENKYVNFRNIDIYSGEIHGYKLGNDVYDIILEYLDKGLIINQLTVPTNGSWLLKDSICSTVEDYIAKFEKYNTRLCYSFSVDGAIVDKKGRPLRNKSDEDLRTAAFYDKLFEMCKKYGFCWHSVIGAKEAKYWGDNYKWWIAQCAKRGLRLSNLSSILEVRNNDWDAEDIRALNAAQDVQIDYFINEVYTKADGTPDLESFTRHVLLGKFDDANINISIRPNQDCHLGCTINHNLTIRLGDLAICPCHRTAYDSLLYGKFKVVNDKIVGIEAKNVEMAMKVLCSDVSTSLIGCDTCDFKPTCFLPCFGACKEYTKDPFITDKAVCEMLKAKTYHLCKRYEALGLFDIYKNLIDNDVMLSKQEYNKLINLKNKILLHKELEIYE